MSSASMHYRALHEKQFQQLLKNEGAYKRLRMIRDCEAQYLPGKRRPRRAQSLEKYHKARGLGAAVTYGGAARGTSQHRSPSLSTLDPSLEMSMSPPPPRNAAPSPFGQRKVIHHPYPEIKGDASARSISPEADPLSYSMPILPKLAGMPRQGNSTTTTNKEPSSKGIESQRSQQPFQYYSEEKSSTLNHVTFSARRKLELASITRELVAELKSPPPGSPLASRANTPKRRRSQSPRMDGTASRRGSQRSEANTGEHKRQFCAVLRRKFGSVCSGWRFGFRYDGAVHFSEFCSACRQHGIGGDIRSVWAELDANQTGVVKLEDVHPQAAATLKAFYEQVQAKAKNTLAAWRILDPHNTQQVEKHQFISRIKKMNYEGDPEQVWPFLLAPFKKTLSVDEFDPVAGLAQRRGDDDMLALTENSVNYKRAMTLKARQELAKEQGRHLLKTMSARTVEEFKDLLKRRYSNLWRAWRKGLGCDATKKLSFTEFCQACRDVGFHGNVKGTFMEMDDDNSGVISLKELDEPTYNKILNFRRLCIEKKGSLLEAWICHFDLKHSGRVELPEWKKKCEELGYKESAEEMFRLLLLEDRNFMNVEDFDGKVAGAVRLDDYRALLDPTRELALDESPTGSPENSPSPRKGPMDQTFEERQEETIRSQLKRAKDMARQKFAMLRRRASYLDAGEDLGPQDMHSFKAMLKRKFGSVARGWRAGMCRDSCNEGGKLAFNEFCNAARALGYVGNLSYLFKTMDDDGNGRISLDELDPDAQRRIDTFNRLCCQKYGNLVNAWKKGLDEDKSGRLELDEFIRKCGELGYPEDPKLLFNTMLLEQGRQYLTMGDLDPFLMKNYLSGHHELILAPKLTSADRMRMTFQERQSQSFSARLANFMGLEKREALVKAEKEKKAAMLAAKSEEGFKQQIVRRHGSMARAWRYGLDSDGNGRLSFNEFMQAARTLGYAGNMKTLWVVLGGEEMGFLGMQHLDKPLKDDLDAFKKCLLERYTTIVDAWAALLDLQPGQTKNDEIDFDEFKEICSIVGFESKSQSLKDFFGKQLIAESHRRALILSDLKILMLEMDKKTYNEQWFGGADRAKEWMKTYNAHSGKQQTVAAEIAKEKEEYEKKMGAIIAKSKEGFKKMVLHRYGSLLRAWRQGLDTDGNGRLSYNEFIMAARTFGYTGNIKNLWESLGGFETGFLGLAAFEPDLRDDVHAFKNCLLDRYGCIILSWEGMLREIKEETGKTKPDVDWEDFKLVVGKIGFTPKTSLKKFFHKELIAEAGRTRLLLEDLDVLMIELDRKQYQTQWYGSVEAAKSAALLKHGTGTLHRTKSNVLELQRRQKTMDAAMFDSMKTDEIKKRVSKTMGPTVNTEKNPRFRSNSMQALQSKKRMGSSGIPAGRSVRSQSHSTARREFTIAPDEMPEEAPAPVEEKPAVVVEKRAPSKEEQNPSLALDEAAEEDLASTKPAPKPKRLGKGMRSMTMRIEEMPQDLDEADDNAIAAALKPVVDEAGLFDHLLTEEATKSDEVVEEKDPYAEDDFEADDAPVVATVADVPEVEEAPAEVAAPVDESAAVSAGEPAPAAAEEEEEEEATPPAPAAAEEEEEPAAEEAPAAAEAAKEEVDPLGATTMAEDTLVEGDATVTMGEDATLAEGTTMAEATVEEAAPTEEPVAEEAAPAVEEEPAAAAEEAPTVAAQEPAAEEAAAPAEADPAAAEEAPAAAEEEAVPAEAAPAEEAPAAAEEAPASPAEEYAEEFEKEE
ncbi:unnamed protein product [Amoebophrya sp. A25]|nr:unnamed protein product [Amoebophrya sp. A25]|eukprot:GSA25T00001761001.1